MFMRMSNWIRCTECGKRVHMSLRIADVDLCMECMTKAILLVNETGLGRKEFVLDEEWMSEERGVN